MIKCNLPVLLAERGLKITKVSIDTGISRTTLTSLNNNYSQGIQFDTLNKLCGYLKVLPGELFLYIPYEIKIKNFSLDGEEADFLVEFSYNGKEYEYEMFINIYLDYYSDTVDSIDITYNLAEYNGEYKIKERELLHKILNSIPLQFLKDIDTEVYSLLCEKLENQYTLSNTPSVIYNWGNVIDKK